MTFARTVVLVAATWALAAGVLSRAIAAPLYTFTVLETLGGTGSSAYGINNAGQVVGYSWTSGNVAQHATLWSVGGGATDLGTLPGKTSSYALGINDTGQIVGYSYDTTGDTASYATLWNGGTPTALGGGIAYAINSSGQIAGFTAAGSYYHASFWNAAPPRDLGTLGGLSSNAFAINNVGQVVRVSSFIQNAVSPQHATLWSGNTKADLGTLAGTNGVAHSAGYGINDAGQVVGISSTTGNLNAPVHATLWSGNTPSDLGTLPGGTNSEAQDINNVGQIVGASNTGGDADVRATLWDGGTPVDLNTLLDANKVSEGWFLRNATRINDSGWIIGQAENSLTGESHAYLLSVTAVPEPGTLEMMLAGLGLFGIVARRRGLRRLQ